MRYILYARRSSDEKSNKQLQSIQGQAGDLVQLASDLNLHVVETLEESRTAKEPGRPVFNLMIEKLKRGESDAILCWHIDRLSRNELDSGTIRWLLRKGVIKEIRTPHKVYLPDDSAFITAVESAQSEQFSIDLSLRVNRGMKQKCASGEIPFRAPQGYRNDKLLRKVETDPERFPLICKVFHTVLLQTHTVAEIHRLMHQEWGYRKRPYGNSPTHVLSLNALHNLLSNTFYAGYFSWQGEVYTHNLPRAVTKDQFERVQDILSGRGHKRVKHHVFPYTGLIICATCGYKVTAEVSKGHTYYHCNNRLGTCTKKGIREEEIERQVDVLLESITLDSEFESLALKVLDTLRTEELSMQQNVFESQQKAVAEIKRQKDALLGLYLQGHLEADEYARKKQELSEQEVTLKLNEEQAEQTLDHTYEIIENVANFTTHARSLFSQGTPEMKRFIARHLGVEYILNSGELSIELNPLFVPVRSQFKIIEENLKKVEPSQIGSDSLRSGACVSKNAVWQTTLCQYRNAVRTNNWALPKLQAPVDNEFALAA